MTEQVQAGRLNLEAYLDTSGVTRGLQRRLDAETAKIRAKIKTELDTRGLIKQAKDAARKAQDAAVVRLKTELDTRGLIGQTVAAAASASAAAKVKIKAEIEQGSLAAATAQIAAATRDRVASIEVNADTAGAEAQVDTIARDRQAEIEAKVKDGTATEAELAWLARNRRVVIDVDAKGGLALTSAAQAMTTMGKAPMIAGGVYLLVGAVVQLGGALVAVVSSASQAVGVLAALPNLAGVAAQAIAPLVIGFQGVGDAVAALGEVEAAGADDATAYAQAQRAAAQAVASAREGIEDAEWALARAHEAAREAQEALNEAREDARERIRDLNRELRQSADDEQSAMDALITARENLQDVEWNLAASDQEKREAERQVREAERALEEQREQHRDLARETAKANKEGVEGSDQVQAARDALRDANHNVQESVEGLSDAHRALADAQRAAAEAAKDQSTAQANLADAFDKLSPAGQRFARFLYSLKPLWDDLKESVQEALLPPVQRGIEKALPLLGTLKRGLVDSARVMGNWVEDLGTLLGSKAFREDTAKTMDSNNRAMKDFGQAGINLVKVLSRIATVAGPVLLEPFAKWVRLLTGDWRDALESKEGMDNLEDFLIRARQTAKRLWRIMGNLAGAIHGVGEAATPTGDELLAMFERTTKRWDEWANSDAGQARMQEFFESTEEPMRAFGEALGEVLELLVRLGETGGGPISGFFTMLTWVIEGLNAVLDTPYIGTFVGWLLTLAGMAGAIMYLGGILLSFAGSLVAIATSGAVAWVASFVWGLTTMVARTVWWSAKILAKVIWTFAKLVARATWWAAQMIAKGLLWTARMVARMAWWSARMLARFIAATVKMVARAVWWSAQMIAKGMVWTVVTLARMAVWSAQMIARMVATAAVFVARWVWMGVQALANAARIAAAWLIAMGPVGWIIAGVIALIAIFVLAYKKIGWFRDGVNAALRAVRAAAAAVWTWIKKHWKLLLAILTGPFGLAALFIIKKWDKIKAAGQAVWNWIKNNWKLLVAILTGPIGIAVALIVSKWGWLRDRLKWVWEHGIKPVFDALKKFVTQTIPDAFQDAVDGIETIWEGLKEIAAMPVEFIVNTVYNDGLRKVINAIPGVDDLDEVSFNYARGTSSVLPGYTPGRDPHNFVSTDGRMRLGLSGGEGIIRPELVRAIGARGIDYANAAARRGVGAARTAMEKVVGYANGTVLPKVLHFARGGFLGGRMPLDGGALTNTHPLPYYNTGATFAGDFNSPNDLASPPSAVRAWMAGTVAQVNRWATSYGNHVMLNNSGGMASLYAHLSSIAVRVGQKVSEGAMLGRVGQTGNASGAHLHFETRGGYVPLTPTDASQQLTPEQLAEMQADKDEGGSWKDAAFKIIDLAGDIGGWLGKFDDLGPWGGMMLDAVKDMGNKVRDWVNEKIPNKIAVKYAPDIPLPDNPFPDIFDSGGNWATGRLGINTSGGTETVFTNREIVTHTQSLADLARSLRAMVVEVASPGGGDGALVGELTLNARAEEMPGMLREANYELTKIKLGGVHARTP